MDPLSGLLKAGSSLVLVIGLMALSAYTAKRYLGPRFGVGKSGPLIQVLSRTYIGPKKEIALIGIGEAVLVVGITTTQISLLTSLDGASLPKFLSEKIKRADP